MASILSLFTPPGAEVGTGIIHIVSETKKQGLKLPNSVVRSVIKELPGLFGGYPDHKDIAPSAIFIAVFSLIAIGHAFVFFKNRHFYLSLGLFFYAVCRVIGFGLRVAWAKDVLAINTGIASTSFSQVSVLYINIMTVILGHRVLEARNPRLGGAWWFKGNMIVIYLLVLGVIAMAIVGQSIPYLYFLSPKHFHMCQKVARAAAILEILYSLLAAALIFLAAVTRCSSQYHHQDPRTAGLEEKASDSEHSHADANVAASAETGRPNHLKISKLQALHIVGSSILLTINCCFRCAATFVPGHSSWIFEPVVFYVFYGAVEAIVNIFYLVFRIQDHFNY